MRTKFATLAQAMFFATIGVFLMMFPARFAEMTDMGTSMMLFAGTGFAAIACVAFLMLSRLSLEHFMVKGIVAANITVIMGILGMFAMNLIPIGGSASVLVFMFGTMIAMLAYFTHKAIVWEIETSSIQAAPLTVVMRDAA